MSPITTRNRKREVFSVHTRWKTIVDMVSWRKREEMKWKAFSFFGGFDLFQGATNYHCGACLVAVIFRTISLIFERLFWKTFSFSFDFWLTIKQLLWWIPQNARMIFRQEEERNESWKGNYYYQLFIISLWCLFAGKALINERKSLLLIWERPKVKLNSNSLFLRWTIINALSNESGAPFCHQPHPQPHHHHQTPKWETRLYLFVNWAARWRSERLNKKRAVGFRLSWITWTTNWIFMDGRARVITFE